MRTCDTLKIASREKYVGGTNQAVVCYQHLVYARAMEAAHTYPLEVEISTHQIANTLLTKEGEDYR